MPQNLKRSSRAKGFTLIELLVVVAIIVVLISLLMPSLSKARQQARQTACLSNLRSIATWAMQYASEWEGTLPTNGDGSSQSYYSSVAGEPWYNNDFWYNKAGGPTYTLYGGWSKPRGGVMICPESAAVRPLRASNSNNTYGINAYVGGRRDFSNSSTTRIMPNPKTTMLSPNTYWFADSRISSYSGGTWDFHPYLLLNSTSLPTNDTTWPWHWPVNPDRPVFNGHPNVSTNFVFGDGHGESIRRSQYMAMSGARLNTFVGNPF